MGNPTQTSPPILSSAGVRAVLAGGLILTLACALFNLGIIAIDDYYNGVAIMVPAQDQVGFSVLANKGIHPYVPKIVLASLAKAGLWLGFESSVGQLRFALFWLALFGFLGCAVGGVAHFRAHRDRVVAATLLSFFFLCPLFYSRPMVESLSLPLMTLSSLFACRYWSRAKPVFLAIAMAVLVVASMMRFQVGICAIVLCALPWLRSIKENRAEGGGIQNALPAFAAVIGVGVLGFVLSGLLETSFGRSFHQTLWEYIDYNLRFSASRHGAMPFYLFFAIVFGLTLPPALVLRYRGLDWKKEYGALLPAVLYFVVFLLSHSLSPHKEERFFIPALGLFLVLITPLVRYLIDEKLWVRLGYFAVLNGVLLLMTTFSVPQRNTVDLVRALSHHPEVTSIGVASGHVPFIPWAYSRHKAQLQVFDANQLVDKNSAPNEKDCGKWIVAPSRFSDQMAQSHQEYERIARFAPGPLEALIVALNPGKNARRASLDVWQHKSCPGAFGE